MELTPLRYVVAIARAGHMTRAAEGLGVTQSTLSSSLRRLEDELGTPLFHRTGKGVELTDAGAAFVEHAQQALRQADAGRDAVRRVLGLDAGRIRIGGGATAVAYLLPAVVSRFRGLHPEVRFHVREAGSAVIAAGVRSGELDLGIVTLPTRSPGDDDLMTIATAEDELLLLPPANNPLAGRASFRWRELDGEPVVAFEAESAVRLLIDAAAARSDTHLNVVMELRSIDAIKRMVMAGIGVGFVSRFALGDGETGLACDDGRLTRSLALVRRRDRTPSPAASKFEQLLLESFGVR